MKNYSQVAERLEAPVIRGFSFWAKGPFEAAFPKIVGVLREVAPLLENTGVTFALEFDPAVYASNAAKVRRLIDSVGSPRIQALYDPGNDLWDPEREVPFPDGYNQLRERICHIHLKDAVRNGSHRHRRGRLHWAIFSAPGRRLQWLAGRRNPLSVEVQTEDQLKRPAGHAFSEGGEEASRECLESLFRLFDKLDFPRISENKG